jgi:phosphoglycolate phosphatase
VSRARRFVVFDLDGTLVDSRRDLALSANLLLEGYGGRPLDEATVTTMVGEGARVLVERVLAAAGLTADVDEALARFAAIYDRHLVEFTRPYAGVAGAVARLAEHSMLGVLTNKPQRPAEFILEHFGLAPHFAQVVGGGVVWPRKPAPDALLAMMSRAGVAAGDTALVGDSWVDLETARAAGVQICLARYGFGFSQIDPARLRGDEWIADDPGTWLQMFQDTRRGPGPV